MVSRQVGREGLTEEGGGNRAGAYEAGLPASLREGNSSAAGAQAKEGGAGGSEGAGEPARGGRSDR